MDYTAFTDATLDSMIDDLIDEGSSIRQDLDAGAIQGIVEKALARRAMRRTQTEVEAIYREIDRRTAETH